MPTQSHLQIIDRLRTEIDTLPPQLQAVAKYIIDHPGDFGIDPIRLTADKVGVSSNSLVRLSDRMGFDGFEDFRAPFRNALVTEGEERLGIDWLDSLAQGDGIAKVQAGLARNEINVVSRSLRQMDPAKVETAVDFMTRSRRCFVTATRVSYALAYYFHYVGRMALPGLQLVPRHMGSAVDDLLDADEDDCLLAVTVAPYSAETIKSLRFARGRGARIILVSDSDIIAPKIDPDIVFPVSTRSQHHFGCFAGAMVVLECLLGHLVAAGGHEARKRISDYEAMREDTGAYWKAPKPPRVRGA